MNKYTILIPSYNDWDCLNLLIPRIDKVAYDIVGEVSILIVNDASTIKNNLSINKLNNVKKIEIINLLKNVKAQKAVATAIEHLRNIKFDGSIILMDADGQDDPKDISILINKSINEPEKTISVCRLKRQEGLIFKFFYHFYLLITFIFTFKYMHFGAFSYLHYTSFDKILSTSDINLAYAASLAKHFKNRNIVYADRQKRLLGDSKNNYLSLIHYALKIISVFRYQVVINSVIFFLILYILSILFFPFILFIILSLIIISFNILIFIIHITATNKHDYDLKENIKNLEKLEI